MRGLSTHLRVAAVMAMPTPRFPVYVIVKTIDMGDFDDGKSLAFDFNGDGSKEKIMSISRQHYNRNLVLMMAGKKHDFTLWATYGLGKLHVLASKTNGMHDIMVEDYVRTIYKWNGSTYVH